MTKEELLFRVKQLEDAANWIGYVDGSEASYTCDEEDSREAYDNAKAALLTAIDELFARIPDAD